MTRGELINQRARAGSEAVDLERRAERSKNPQDVLEARKARAVFDALLSAERQVDEAFHALELEARNTIAPDEES